MRKQYVCVNELKPDQVDAYRQAHKHIHEGPFKDQLDVLRKAGAVQCQSYLYKNFVVMIWVCDDDIDTDFMRLAEDPRRAAWEEFTQPMFANSPKFDGSVKTEGIEKVLDLNQQLDEGRLSQY